MIARLLRYFIPENVSAGTAVYDGMAFKVLTLLTTGIISFLYIFLAYFTSFYIGIYVCLVFVFLHYALLLSFKKGIASDNTIANVFGVMSLTGLSLCSYYTGGHESPILYWFVSTLVIGFWFSDLPTRRLWIGIVLLILSFFFLGYSLDHQYPVAMNDELFGLFKFLMAAGVFCYLMIVFKSFDVWRATALKELGDLNASKDRLMSIVAHDLKNPLMVMMFYRFKTKGLDSVMK